MVVCCPMVVEILVMVYSIIRISPLSCLKCHTQIWEVDAVAIQTRAGSLYLGRVQARKAQ